MSTNRKGVVVGTTAPLPEAPPPTLPLSGAEATLVRLLTEIQADLRQLRAELAPRREPFDAAAFRARMEGPDAPAEGR